jgi:hypothetical protein
LIGLVADLVRMNRKMLEEMVYRVRSAELERVRQDANQW